MNNNGLEATNLVIKNEVTQRRLLPVINFFGELSRWLGEQSRRRYDGDANYIPFTNVHTISTSDWTEAYRWTRDTSKQLRVIGDTYVAINKDVRGHLTDAKASAFIATFTDFTFPTFDNYTSTSHNVCIIRPDLTREENFNCTCKQNAKTHSCVHTIGVGILRGTMIPPKEAKVTLLGRKRKRGRKPLAAPAWEHHPFDIVSPLHHPQQNPDIIAGAVPFDALADILDA